METQDRIMIEGTGIYDGTHEFDPSYFTMGEFRRIKQIANLTRGQISAALEHDDTDLWVAFAVVALERQGATFVDVDVFWNARDAKITFIDGLGVDAGPPAGGSSSTAPDETSDTSGRSSDDGSGPSPVTAQSSTGTGFSGLSASPPPTSAA